MFHPLPRPQIVLEGQGRALGQEVEERYQTLLLRPIEVGHDADVAHLVARELRLNLKGADAINLIAEEVNAEGVLRSIREDVDDATTHGKLPRLIHVVDALEALARERSLHLGNLYRVPHGQRHRARIQRVARHYHLGQRIGVRNEVQWRGLP